MAEHLPVLQIVLPLIAAPLCLLVKRSGAAFVVALSACWAAFGMSILLLQRVLADGPISYALGGWIAPWGIEYRVDPLSAFVLLFVSGIGAVVVSYAPKSIGREIPKDRHSLFYTMYMLCLTGLLGIGYE